MLPKKELNIYPKNEENLKALICFYFDKFDVIQEDAIRLLLEKTSLTLNQQEFLIRKLSEAYIPVFKRHLNGQITLTNLISYGFDALVQETIPDTGSKQRQKITNEFRTFVKETEINYNHIEKYN